MFVVQSSAERYHRGKSDQDKEIYISISFFLNCKVGENSYN